MDSPRGRIYLMKGVLEGDLEAEEVQPHIDRCLGCMACETACPSGVRYHELLLPYRALSRGWTNEDSGQTPDSRAARSDEDASDRAVSGGGPARRFRRWITMRTLPYPARFRAAVRAGRAARALRRIAPSPLRPLFDLLPDTLPPRLSLPEVTPAMGTRRARVALLTGCVQSVLDPAINQATVQVLARNGVEVAVPWQQGCCGALAWHSGAVQDARRFARRNFAAFPKDIDAIVVNAAGCGSAMLEYPLAFRQEDDEDAARAFSSKVVDVSVFLDRIGILAPPALSSRLRIAMHDACHLCHAQQVREEPRRLLRAIEGLEVLELGDGERCCGSAGTYNIEQPEIAAELGRMKANVIRETECDAVVSGNIGCIVQVRRHLARPPIFHTMQVLDAAYAETLGEMITSV
jgi:glycolate oxidase iron-sulfur subunit